MSSQTVAGFEGVVTQQVGGVEGDHHECPANRAGGHGVALIRRWDPAQQTGDGGLAQGDDGFGAYDVDCAGGRAGRTLFQRQWGRLP